MDGVTKYCLIGIGHDDSGKPRDLTAVTFRLGLHGAIDQTLYIRDFEGNKRKGILKLCSFVYAEIVDHIYFYNKAAYEELYELARREMITLGWLPQRIFYFDKYAKEHKLNKSLVDRNEPSSSFVLTMFYVMQKELRA